MDKNPIVKGKNPQISIHGLRYASTEFINVASKGYNLLSEAYEVNKKIRVQEFLERTGAIKFGEWRQHPSQCRKLARAVLNTTLILQSIVDDERDLQAAINQKKVTFHWREEQRQQLIKLVKLKTVERENLPEESTSVTLSVKGEENHSSNPKEHDIETDSYEEEFSLHNLPM